MRIFVTHILPEHLVAKYRLSFAACNFSRNLMSGGGFDKVYSIMPLFISGRMEEFEDSNNELIYSSMRHYGGLVAKLAVFIEQIKVFRHINRHDTVWLYNVSVLNVLLILLLKLCKPKVGVYAIELDFTPPTRKLCAMSLYLYLLNHIDGVIKLADSPLFTCENSVCLAGVTPDNGVEAPIIRKPCLEFLLSGVLQPDISSLPMALEAFAQVSDCRLHITGNSDSKQLQEYVQKYPNIIYHGVLSSDAYMDLLHSVTFQLSLRNPDWKDNQCNFPSKIIEALLHNRIIISTIHYLQIERIEYIETERSVEGFVKTLQQIRSMCDEELMDYANQSELVKKNFNPDVWNEWMTKIEHKSKK
ncbi:hypothetical protein AB9N12_16065 [Bacteroides sp. AN502(2024)]|uniref:hypothetical protein n=1 Tax=Bacteroides sp. AN502(2024) TaxID=3160599 RepID=UPI003513F2A6